MKPTAERPVAPQPEIEAVESEYAQMAVKLQDDAAQQAVAAKLEQYYKDDWTEKGENPRPFFGIAAPSGSGKTQLGFTLRSDPRFNVIHVALAAAGQSQGSVENTQKIYLVPQIWNATFELCEALASDSTSYNMALSAWQMHDFGLELFTIEYLSRAFGIVDSEGHPIRSVAQFRAQLWSYARKEDQEIRLPVLVVDEAKSSTNDTAGAKRMLLLRTIVQAAGLAALFMATSVDIVGITSDLPSDSSREAAPEERIWAYFIPTLPRARLTNAEATAIAEAGSVRNGGDSAVLDFLERLRRWAEEKVTGTFCFNPLFLHRVSFAFALAEPGTATIDSVRAAAATVLYGEKNQLRSINGLRGQVQCLLGDALDSDDSELVHKHFAQYRGDDQLWLRGSLLYVRDGQDWQPWCPVPQFPSPQEDPLLPLLLGGCCVGSRSGHPSPFQLRRRARTTTLTSAAALLIIRDSGVAAGSGSRLCVTNNVALSRDGDVLEAITALAVISASQAHGVGGIPVRDFLLHLAAELQAEVPAAPLEWADASHLGQLLRDPDEVVPFLPLLGAAPYPCEILGGIGQFTRYSDPEGTTGLVATDSGGRRKLAAECQTSAGQIFGSCTEANTGVAVVSSFAALQESLNPADANLVKVVVSEGKVALQPVGSSEAVARRRIMCVFECDEDALRRQFRSPQSALDEVYTEVLQSAQQAARQPVGW